MKFPTLMAATIVAGLSFTATAQAVSVSGSTNGTLSSISGCTSPSTCVQNGSNQIYWGGTLGSFFGFPFAIDPSPSTSSVLNAIDGSIFDADGIDVTLGQLSWTNRSTPDSQTDDSFSVNWSLADSFTSPVGTGSLTNLSVNIQNTQNPSGDLIVGFNPAAFTASIPGFTLTNLEVVAGGGSTFIGNTWRNPEGNTGTLTLRGDIVANAVPEPASMTLLGAGLLGLGWFRRRRA